VLETSEFVSGNNRLDPGRHAVCINDSRFGVSMGYIWLFAPVNTPKGGKIDSIGSENNTRSLFDWAQAGAVLALVLLDNEIRF
jgi:hypothetical protein